MKSYIGVKLVQAFPQEKDGQPGYKVVYPDGYESWSPAQAFEDAYLPLENPTKITQAELSAFLADEKDQQLDEKTTLVTARTVTGFVQHEVSSCVDPANYDHELGVSLASNRIKDRLWPMLSFVLQWGRFGLKAVPRKPF